MKYLSPTVTSGGCKRYLACCHSYYLSTQGRYGPVLALILKHIKTCEIHQSLGNDNINCKLFKHWNGLLSTTECTPAGSRWRWWRAGPRWPSRDSHSPSPTGTLLQGRSRKRITSQNVTPPDLGPGLFAQKIWRFLHFFWQVSECSVWRPISY